MSLIHQITAQAKLLAGELNAQQAALLEVLCGVAATALGARMKKTVAPEDCAEVFVTAASLHAVAELWESDGAASVEEFRAGDLTVKKGSRASASNTLRHQAELAMAPYLEDGFCFAGV